MAVPKEEEIYEYRMYKGEDCLLVRWDDGTSSWTPASKLSNGELVRSFSQRCLNILMERKKLEDEDNRKQLERIFLEKILDQNKAKKPAPSELENKKAIIKEICKKDARAYCKKEIPVAQKYQAQESYETSVKPVALRPIMKSEVIGPSVLDNSIFNPISGLNTFKILYKNRKICEFSSFFEQKMQIDLERSIFVHQHLLVTLIHQYMRFYPYMMTMYPVKMDKTSVSDEFRSFADKIKNEKLFMIFKENEHVFVLYLVDENDVIIPFSFSEQIAIFKFQNFPLFSSLEDIVENQNKEMHWDEGNYRTAVQYESCLMFKTKSVPSDVPLFFIGDDSAISSHVENCLKQRVTLLPKLSDNCNVFLANSLCDFAPQILGSSKSNNRTIFTENAFCLDKIQHNSYLFILISNTIASSNINELISFLTKIKNESRNEIAISSDFYELFKKRVHSSASFCSGIIDWLKTCIRSSHDAGFFKTMKKTFKCQFKDVLLVDGNNGIKVTDSLNMIRK